MMEENIVKSKVCTKCEVEWPATKEYFNVNNSKKYKLESFCKICESERKKQKRKENKDNYQPNKLNLISKTCYSCKIEKNINEFGVAKSSSDGFNQCCKSCKRIKTQERSLKNKDNYQYNKYNLISKICCTCKIEKNINEFDINQFTKDGFVSCCTLCKNNYEKQRKQEKRESFEYNKLNLISKKCGKCKIEKKYR